MFEFRMYFTNCWYKFPLFSLKTFQSLDSSGLQNSIILFVYSFSNFSIHFRFNSRLKPIKSGANIEVRVNEVIRRRRVAAESLCIDEVRRGA